MISKKLFSVHSPIWQMVFAITGMLIATTLYEIFVLGTSGQAIITLEQTPTGQTSSISLNLWLTTTLLLGILALVAYSVICSRYNKKHSKKLRPFSLRPNEVIGDDERLLQASANASLKLYSQNHVLFPVFALALIVAASGGMGLVAIVLIVFVAVYYLTYLKAMWPYLGHE